MDTPSKNRNLIILGLLLICACTALVIVLALPERERESINQPYFASYEMCQHRTTEQTIYIARLSYGYEGSTTYYDSRGKFMGSSWGDDTGLHEEEGEIPDRDNLILCEEITEKLFDRRVKE